MLGGGGRGASPLTARSSWPLIAAVVTAASRRLSARTARAAPGAACGERRRYIVPVSQSSHKQNTAGHKPTIKKLGSLRARERCVRRHGKPTAIPSPRFACGKQLRGAAGGGARNFRYQGSPWRRAAKRVGGAHLFLTSFRLRRTTIFISPPKEPEAYLGGLGCARRGGGRRRHGSGGHHR